MSAFVLLPSHAAFGVGEDKLHIGTVDADGVALAGIQRVYRLLKEKDKTIAEQQTRIDDLTKRLEKLERLVSE